MSQQISSDAEWTYNIAGWEVPDGILGGERHRAEHDEHQDEVGEDVVIDEFVAEDAEPGGDRAWAGGRVWDVAGTRVCAHVSTVSKCVLRVGAAEDEEGASLGDGGDLLLLHQVKDDGPRPRRNLRVVLLPGRVVLLVLLANRAARVRTQGCEKLQR